jgi:hypothetical protein
MLLDAQFAVEDGNGILGNMELDMLTEEQQLEYWREKSLLSDGIYKLIDIFGKIVLAARNDCRAVLENMDDEEEIPGVLSETLRAVRDTPRCQRHSALSGPPSGPARMPSAFNFFFDSSKF